MAFRKIIPGAFIDFQLAHDYLHINRGSERRYIFFFLF